MNSQAFDLYGAKPQTFVLNPEEGELMLGSEVSNYLRLFRGTLYKKYPNLWKRGASQEERKVLRDLGFEYSVHTPFLALVKASEIEKIINGSEWEFLSQTEVPIPEKFPVTHAHQTKPKRGTSLLSAMPNTSFHLDAVPCPTVVSRTRSNNKRVRTYPNAFDDLSITNYAQAAEQVEVLVPIRLDLEHENHRVRDTFVWNKNEKIITPEKFSEILCDELDIPTNPFSSLVAMSINSQCELHSSDSVVNDQDDRRVLINLNIHVGNMCLRDQFEWDLSNTDNWPEEFAKVLCAEKGLGGEFMTAIAYSIRGQLSWYYRTYPYSEARNVIENPFRSVQDSEEWGPVTQALSDVEIDKRMRDQDRNTRRIRRLITTNPAF